MLPDARQTRATSDAEESLIGPVQFKTIGAGFLRKVNFAGWTAAVLLFVVLFWVWGLELIGSLIIAFFASTLDHGERGKEKELEVGKAASGIVFNFLGDYNVTISGDFLLPIKRIRKAKGRNL
jgi:hypothetical protein